MSNRKYISITILLLVMIFCLSACSHKGGTPSGVTEGSDTTPSTEVETTEPPAQKLDYEDGSYTLFIYMCGSSLETKNGSATKNITEMLSVPLSDKVNVVIETGGTSKWRKYDIPTEVSRYEVTDGELRFIENCGAKSMGNPDTLSDFLTWGIEAYPAAQFSLIFWDHGGGSIKGVCYDELFANDALSLPELGEALSAGLQKYGTKLDFIGFDACLMATVENAMTVSDYADHLIASQELEPAGGWDYDTFLPVLGTDDVYQSILAGYAEKSAASSNYYTLSHMDLSKLQDILDMFKDLVGILDDQHLQVKAVHAISAATTFGTTSGNGSSDLYDLGNLLSYFLITTDITPFITSITSDTRATATGLSVYFPMNDTSFVEDYYKLNRLSIYSDYLKQFLSYHVQNTIFFESYDIDSLEKNLFSFKLTPESMDYLWKIEYRLFLQESEMTWRELGFDNDIAVQENNVTILFEGNWIQLDGHILYCTPKETNGNITVFESLMNVNGKTAIMLFSFDSESSLAQIIGVTYETDSYSRIFDIPENPVLTPVSIDNTVIRDEAGNVTAQLSSLWFNEENSFQYNADMRINVFRLPDGYYEYTATVYDIYGKEFDAGTVYIQIVDGIANIRRVDTELTGVKK